MKLMSGKKVMRNLFSGKPVDTVPVLLPIIPLGAKTMQVPSAMVAADPALTVQCALQIKQLLAPEGMVLYDISSITEALGGVFRKGMSFPEKAREAGSISLMIETTQRLSATLGKEVAVFAAVPGPVELIVAMTEAGEAGQYFTDQDMMNSLNSYLIDLAREYMENRADGLVVVESKKYFAREELAGVYSQFLTTVGNLAGYYSIPLTIYLRGQDELAALPTNIASLNFKGILFDDCAKPGSLSEPLRTSDNRVFGLTVPEDLLLQTANGLSEYLKMRSAELVGKQFLLSVPWTMTGELSVSHIVGLNDLVKETG